MKTHIIISGYPKSGNTWLTRLTAEIVGCPVAGFWAEPQNRESAIEGLDRQSDFLCYKAHHDSRQMDASLPRFGNGTERFLYILRDPRDVVVSASHFFPINPPIQKLRRLLRHMPGAGEAYDRLFATRDYAQHVLARGLVQGTDQGWWLGTPWKTHLEGYRERGDEVLVIRYEDLKADPLEKAREICRFLGLSRSDETLREAIVRQDFTNKKSQLMQAGEQEKLKILRRGKSGGWREELREAHVRYLEKHLGDYLRELGYPLSTDAVEK